MKRIDIIKRTAAVTLLFAMIFTLGCGGERKEYTPPKLEGYELSGGEYSSDVRADIPDGLLNMNITADGSDSRVIPADSSFTVRTSEATTAEILTANLTITPYTSFAVTEVSETEFTVTPTSPLDEGKIYKFTVGDAENPAMSFVFQTEEGMGIKSTLPADLAVGVALNTGIEITFTDTVKGVDFPKYITVSPDMAGEFMLYPDGKTVVFVPSEKLSADTVYEVTVKKGITGSSGMSTEEDISFKFRTGNSVESGNDDTVSIHSGAREMIFSPDEFPTVSYSVVNLGGLFWEAHDVKVKLYEYGNAEDAKKALFEYEREKFDSSLGGYEFSSAGMTKIIETEITPEVDHSGNYSAQLYFSLPKIEAGVYLMEYEISVTWNGAEYTESYQCIMSVTELRLHTQSFGGETLFWVTDDDGDPVKGAEITASAFERNVHWNTETAAVTLQAYTDEDGTAVIETNGNNAAYVSVSSENGGENDELLAFVSTDEAYEREYFAGYVYTDREVYFSDDNVNYSGVITPFGGATLPEKLYLYVGMTSYGTVEVDGDGGFEGSLPIESYAGWGFNVRFCNADGDVVISKYVRVTQEDKPVYKASLSFDRVFYEYGDRGEVTVRATFYDGTPAPGLRFYVYGNDYARFDPCEVVTDEEGKAVVSFKPAVYAADRVNSTYPVNVYFRAELIGYETTSLTASASVPFFHSDHQLRSERISEKETEVRLYKTDTSGIKTVSDINYDSILGEPAEGEISVKLIKYTYIKVKSGTTYDPITKTATENYYYDRKESVEKSYTANFKNGVVTLPHIEVGDDDKVSYFYEITYRDKRNSMDYSLSLWAVKGERARSDWYYEGYSLHTDKDSYAVGDDVELTFTKGEKKADTPVLYAVYDSEGLKLSSVSDGGFGFEYTDPMIFNCRVYAVTYDGGFVYRSVYPKYDTEKSSLTVRILPDRDTYKPGDTAVVKIKLTDENGAPVSGRVTLGVVDEACFSLGEQNLMPVEAYFGSIGGIVYPSLDGRFYPFAEIEGNVYCGDYSCLYCQRSDITCEDMAEAEEAPTNGEADESASGSGEEEIKVRDYFSDNPVFSTVTAENGEAVISFTVPDNITEWRLSAAASSDIQSKTVSGRRLGAAVTDVICTLPYFINVSACELYIAGDDVAMSVRSFGSALKGEMKAEYRAVLYCGENVIAELETEAIGNEYGWINFGKLEEGAYTAVIEGSTEAGGDAVETAFTVTKSAVSVDVRREISPEMIGELEPVMYPVTLSFYNKALAEYGRIVDEVRYSYVKNRADSRAAYYIAMKAAEKLYGTEESDVLGDIKSEFGNGYGLVSAIDYGTPSAELSAKLLAIAPEALPDERKEQIISELRSMYSVGEFTDEEELAAVLLGLASQGEPILDVLYYAAEGCRGYTLTAKLYLAAAFAYIGDFSAASELYEELRAEFGFDGEGGEMSFKGNDTEETIKNTANALITAARIDRCDAEGMVKYLLAHTSGAEYYGLELAAYVKFYMPTDEAVSEFSYRFDGGEEVKVKLTAGKPYTLTLTKTGLEAFEILTCDEDVTVRAAYEGRPEDAMAGGEASGEFTIERKITPYDAGAGLYLVTLEFSGRSDRNYESFSIFDTIPTGARFVSLAGTSGGEITVSGGKRGYAHIYNEAGQRMKGYISIYTPYSEKLYNWNSVTTEYTFSGSVSYVIRGAVKGGFIAESPMLRNERTEVYALGARMSVVIDDGEWKTGTVK